MSIHKFLLILLNMQVLIMDLFVMQLVLQVIWVKGTNIPINKILRIIMKRYMKWL